MNLNKEISTPIAILIIVVVAVLVSVLVWQFTAPKEEPAPKQPSDYTTQTACKEASYYWYDDACHKEQIETAGWETYRNEEFGFEVKYPGKWRILDEEKTGERFLLGLNNPDREVGEIGRAYDLTVEIYDNFEVFSQKGDNRCLPAQTLRECLPLFTEEYQVIDMGGNSGFEALVKGHGLSYTIFLKREREIIVISPLVSIETLPGLQLPDSTFNQILSSFRFIEKESEITEGWKTYTNTEYRYSIKYPKLFTIEETSYGTEFIPPEYQKCKENQPACPTLMVVHIEETDPKQSLEEWIEDYWDLEEFREFKITPEESGGWIDCIEKATLGKDIQGYKLHLWRQAWGECHYYGKSKNTISDIVTQDMTLKCSACDDNPIFNRMLSTFRFVENGE